MQETVCFITGHRPHRFKFKYNESYKLCVKIKRELKGEITRAYKENNVRRFWVGGAIGVDTWAGEIILGLRKQEQYCDMELLVAIPFPKYGADFDAKQKQRYQHILSECTDSVIVSPRLSEVAYKKRNHFMVDSSQFGIAVYDNDRSIRSGTGMTVHYAVKKGVPMCLIHPDTAITNQPS